MGQDFFRFAKRLLFQAVLRQPGDLGGEGRARREKYRREQGQRGQRAGEATLALAARPVHAELSGSKKLQRTCG